jgi:hypothetical protein
VPIYCCSKLILGNGRKSYSAPFYFARRDLICHSCKCRRRGNLRDGQAQYLNAAFVLSSKTGWTLRIIEKIYKSKNRQTSAGMPEIFSVQKEKHPVGGFLIN